MSQINPARMTHQHSGALVVFRIGMPTVGLAAATESVPVGRRGDRAVQRLAQGAAVAHQDAA